MSEFPDGFLWGASTAAHQVEGQNTGNDWWDWEHDPASPCVEPSGDAIDQWHRYPQDMALLASLGHNAHRLSLEWSRIEPAPGEVSQAALDHYARVLDCVADNGMTPLVTLYHFSLPRWFAKAGGWLAPDALDRFARYSEVVAQRLGDRMPYAFTVNEPQIVALECYVTGEHPPGHQDLGEAAQVNRTLAQAHDVALAALRAGRGSPKVGTCLQLPVVEPLRPEDEQDVAVADHLRTETAQVHLDALRAAADPGDFVGLQYYTRARVDASSPAFLAPPPEGGETTLMGWEVFPEGFLQQLRLLGGPEGPGLPVLVTENGIATADDAQRVRYLLSHLEAVRTALAEGVDVRGYTYWSAFDNFEWARGYAPTFGLVGIDRAGGLRRVVRPSAALYGEVIRTGSLDPLRAAVRAAGG